jgi:FtsZ-interacting cell division protein ZipA
MPELRLILLILGVLFVAGIAGFEWWRARGSRPLATMRRDDVRDEPARPVPAIQALPEINVVRDTRVAQQDSLPVIELRDTDDAGPATGISVSDDVAVDVSHENTSTQAILRAHDGPYVGQDDEISEVRVFEEQPVHGPHLVLAWPDEALRRIVTLRVLPQAEPRFQGRALRQAFGAAGFWHGPLDIYHLPDREGRVIVSAAALAHPGTFDPSIMDSQRFSGLNMFAVLPGPLAESETVDELVHSARTLAERLGGKLTDQHGEELTSQRIARLRESAEAPKAARAASDA